MPFNFNVELDWNGDGDFADVHENISSEVKAITIEYGRDNDLQRAQAGRARIVVRDSNANWFYGNQSSDIVATYGGIYPARAVRVWSMSPTSSQGFIEIPSSNNVNLNLNVGRPQSGHYTITGTHVKPWAYTPNLAGNVLRDLPVRAEALRVLLVRQPNLSVNVSGGLIAFALQAIGSGDLPVSGQADIAVAYISGDDLPNVLNSAEFRTATFSPQAVLYPEQQYSLVARALSASDGIFYSWRGISADATYYKSYTGSGITPVWVVTTQRGQDCLFYGRTVYPIFTGLTDDVAAEPGKSQRQATIYANDGTDQLQRAKITMALQENKYSDGNSGLVNLALDRAGWPATRRAISSAELDLYPLVHTDRLAAKTFLEDIERSEFGLGYIRNDGYFAWEDRNYRTTWARCTSSQWTCTENEHRGITPISPLAGIINTAILRAQPKTKSADLDVIWSLQENAAGSNSPFLGTGSVTNYWAKYALSGQVPNIAGDVAALISGTDFTANTARDGSGTDKTVQISTAITIFAGSAKLAVTNLSDGAYLTKLQVRGKIYRDDPPLEVVAEDTSSQTAYLERHFEADLPYYSNAATMQAVADAIIAARKNPKAVYEVELVNADDTIWEQILARRISDRITLSNSAYNISGDFYIEKIRHEISEAGKFHRCWWTVTAV